MPAVGIGKAFHQLGKSAISINLNNGERSDRLCRNMRPNNKRPLTLISRIGPSGRDGSSGTFKWSLMAAISPSLRGPLTACPSATLRLRRSSALPGFSSG